MPRGSSSGRWLKIFTSADGAYHNLCLANVYRNAVGHRTLPDVLVAVRAMALYRTLMLTMERIGIENPATLFGRGENGSCAEHAGY